MSVCPHEAWQDVPLNGRKCVDCGMWLEDYPETRPQPTASVDAEQVWRKAYTRFNATIAVTTGDGNQAAAAVIQAYGDARADAARQEGAWEAGKEINAFKDALAQARAEISELKENSRGTD